MKNGEGEVKIEDVRLLLWGVLAAATRCEKTCAVKAKGVSIGVMGDLAVLNVKRNLVPRR